MIRVEKPTAVPAALIDIQNQIESDLLTKKEKFKWTNEVYSTPIKENLKKLYHNKCAFCQIELTETDTEAKFTVEHYRPKTHYWWLGNEWTNLFPTCDKCNNNKGDDFPLRYERNRVNQPVIEHNTLVRDACKADCEKFLAEQPYFLHPEVDCSERFFEFKADGTVIPLSNLNSWDNSRALKMIDKFLGIPSIVEKRLKKIKEIQADLGRVINNFLQICGDGYDKKHIKLGFNPFFEKLLAAMSYKSEFSQLGYWMSENIDEFLLKNYNIEIQKLIKYALKIFITEYRY